ncbi:hypothetical protein CG709_17795 [Lachnotalea glycerini]|nr:hypothetical protein CG709_17795 [Lachnotalea glycerini]
MMSYFRKKLSLLLAFAMLITTMGTTVNANVGQNTVVSEQISSISINTITVMDSGVYIKGTYYSQSEFIQLLNNAEEITQNPADGLMSNRSAIALAAGTWWIPGVGEVVVTAAGVVVVAGVAITAGNWVYKAVTNWFAKRAFNNSAENAVNNCNSNKQNHIMNQKHNWNKFNKDPKWSDVSPILIKALKEGTEKWETGDQYIRTLVYKGNTVVVRFIKDAEGLVKYTSTAWTE